MAWFISPNLPTSNPNFLFSCHVISFREVNSYGFSTHLYHHWASWLVRIPSFCNSAYTWLFEMMTCIFTMAPWISCLFLMSNLVTSKSHGSFHSIDSSWALVSANCGNFSLVGTCVIQHLVEFIRGPDCTCERQSLSIYSQILPAFYSALYYVELCPSPYPQHVMSFFHGSHCEICYIHWMFSACWNIC